MNPSSFVIAGTDSGAGKTTVTVALLAALAARGLKIQAFKAGPDYIDPTYHNRVAPSQRSRNLDFWLCDEARVRFFYERAMKKADVGVVEGVMGLFDGKDARTSTASLAKFLGLPVILVIDASRMAQSIGAYVHGFLNYDPEVKIAGIILNRVGSEGHYELLRETIESRFPVSVFGYLPNDKELMIPERHLGLVPALENKFDAGELRELAEKNINVDQLIQTTTVGACGRTPLHTHVAVRTTHDKKIRLGLALDTAFHFYYEDALDELKANGFEIIPFSPLADEKLPEDLDALYFGGGFPEVFEKELSHNQPMINAIRRWVKEQKPIYAECGGFMYLVDSIGAIPGRITMTDRLQNFGYKEVRPLHDTFLFSSKDRIRVHEFHYSAWEGPDLDNHFAFGSNGCRMGFWNGHILASYLHCHLGAYPEAVRRWRDGISSQQDLHKNRR